jgi:hypothetical protein
MNELLRDELAELLKEFSGQIRPAGPTSYGLSSYGWFDANYGALAPIVQTPRARKEREVMRITGYYPLWGPTELKRLLDRECAERIEDISNAALERIVKRMRELHDSAQHGCEPPEAPPAT